MRVKELETFIGQEHDVSFFYLTNIFGDKIYVNDLILIIYINYMFVVFWKNNIK
jgi:hypothetical protein